MNDPFGTWLAAFLTLCIFSFLYKDNPFYKLAEHIFVGVSAAYYMCLGFWQTIMPNLVLNLQKGKLLYWIPAAMGLMILARLLPKGGWISRWPLAFGVGIFAGQNIVYTMQAQVLQQVESSIGSLWGVPWSDLVINWIILVGVLTGLLYFYFSVSHDSPFMRASSKLGVRMLMIAFGATFGYTVMARVSLLIGRVMFFTDDWWPVCKATFGWH